MSPLYPDVEAFSSMIQKLWTTNVFLKCLAMRALLAYLCIYVCALLSPCVFVYRAAAQFKPLRRLFASGKLRHRCAQQHGKETQNPSRHYLPLIRALNGWINKSLFRIVFGEGIVPAAPPLGPWLELRGSTLCSTPGGYEEQMSCLLPSSSRLKAAHTSLKMTSWKVEPRKLLELFCMSIFGRWLAGLKRFWRESWFVAGPVCCSQEWFTITCALTEPLVLG